MESYLQKAAEIREVEQLHESTAFLRNSWEQLLDIWPIGLKVCIFRVDVLFLSNYVS